MGSFAFTCCISGLPIEAGDAVRYLLLQSSPFGEGGDHVRAPHCCGVRTPPLRAKYNDYGSVEQVEEGPARDVWTEMLALDLIEKGVGDNTCHDVAARADMSFDDLLEAAWEERLEVRRPKRKRIRLPGEKRAVAKGIPTMRRVERVITKAGWALGENSGEYIVDALRRGEVRVREGGYGDRGGILERLARKLRGRYAVMIRCGSGAYGWSPELIVAPKPGTVENGHAVTLQRKEKEPTMHLRQVMIRGDVWQALLSGTVETWSGRLDVGAFRAAAREAWEKWYRPAPSEDPNMARLREMVQEYQGREGMLGFLISDNPSIGGVGLNTAWSMLVKKTPTDEQRERFLDSVAELAFIQIRLMSVRFKWQPAPLHGPQCGKWDEHVAHLRALLDVAEKRKAEEDAERAKWEQEDTAR